MRTPATTQGALFDATPAPPKLGPRQQLALAFVAASEPDGATADEVGVAVHAGRGTHDQDTRCDWCSAEGNDVLRSCAMRELVVRRKADGRWHLRTAPASESRDMGEVPW